ncbi:hypothetical protein HQ571_05090 [Candidatus Kuenenbacteria bacterium]|nr:hypothetical protein [Candidatus Kuenenbacteria bacterium]
MQPDRLKEMYAIQPKLFDKTPKHEEADIYGIFHKIMTMSDAYDFSFGNICDYRAFPYKKMRLIIYLYLLAGGKHLKERIDSVHDRMYRVEHSYARTRHFLLASVMACLDVLNFYACHKSTLAKVFGEHGVVSGGHFHYVSSFHQAEAAFFELIKPVIFYQHELDIVGATSKEDQEVRKFFGHFSNLFNAYVVAERPWGKTGNYRLRQIQSVIKAVDEAEHELRHHSQKMLHTMISILLRKADFRELVAFTLSVKL